MNGPEHRYFRILEALVWNPEVEKCNLNVGNKDTETIIHGFSVHVSFKIISFAIETIKKIGILGSSLFMSFSTNWYTGSCKKSNSYGRASSCRFYWTSKARNLVYYGMESLGRSYNHTFIRFSCWPFAEADFNPNQTSLFFKTKPTRGGGLRSPSIR